MPASYSAGALPPSKSTQRWRSPRRQRHHHRRILSRPVQPVGSLGRGHNHVRDQPDFPQAGQRGLLRISAGLDDCAVDQAGLQGSVDAGLQKTPWRSRTTKTWRRGPRPGKRLPELPPFLARLGRLPVQEGESDRVFRQRGRTWPTVLHHVRRRRRGPACAAAERHLRTRSVRSRDDYRKGQSNSGQSLRASATAMPQVQVDGPRC